MAGGVGSTAMEELFELVPMEDTIQALMEFLVYPLLPLRDSSLKPPTISQQEDVAKQMHAVVLLYNYYHRKQFPQLEFLGFESFCKTASITKPSLLMYMKFMCGESGDLDKQLSITEKMIMDACHMCTALDASKDAPNMEEWPVSKVAVFLIDHTKKNCLLEFSSITHGVWSLVEKDFDIPCDNLGGAPQMQNASKKTRTASGCSVGGSLANEDVLQQLAFSAVKLKTGINQASLSILERHLTYSLSQEKTTTRLYFMQYPGTVNDDEVTEVPIKDVMNSLRGPLVRRGLAPEVAPVVEYYHLLPYIGILSDWLFRETHHDCSPLPRQRTNVVDNCSIEPDVLPNMKGREISNSSFRNGQTRLNTKVGKTFTGTVNKEGNAKYCRTGSDGGVCKAENQAHSSSMESDQFPTMEDHEMNDKSHWNGQTVGFLSKTSRKENEIINTNGNGRSCMGGSSGAATQNLADSSSLQSALQLLPSEDGIRSTDSVFSDTHPNKSEKASIQEGEEVSVDGLKDKADNIIDLVKKPWTIKGMDGRPLSIKHTSNAGILVQDRTSVDDLPLVPVQFNSQSCDTFHLKVESKKNDLLQASLRVLQKKRDELCHQQRLLEDEIALCDMNIQRITSDGEENLMLRIDSVVEACNEFCSSRMHMDASLCCGAQRPLQNIKRRRLSEAVLCLRSPCQELDDICCENNWVLPRYSVFPSLEDGRFQANVTVQGMEFECSGAGDLKSNPREARESSATNMLSKLRSMATQAQ